jgi:hypothetical protein
MTPHPGVHSVLVLDNFVTHHNEDFIAMVEDAGAYVLHLAPYSPDLNPIELLFAQLKAWLRRHKDWVNTVRARACARGVGARGARAQPDTSPPSPPPQVDPVTAIDAACQSVTANDCLGYIERACREHGNFYMQP